MTKQIKLKTKVDFKGTLISMPAGSKILFRFGEVKASTISFYISTLNHEKDDSGNYKYRFSKQEVSEGFIITRTK